MGADGRWCPSEVALEVAPGGAISSCVQPDLATLRDMPIAVTVSVPDAHTSVALDGVEFSTGRGTC